MKCPYCGSEVKDNAAFCPVCRKPLLDEEPVEENNDKKDRKNLIIKASLCASTVLAAGVLLHTLRKKD